MATLVSLTINPTSYHKFSDSKTVVTTMDWSEVMSGIEINVGGSGTKIELVTGGGTGTGYIQLPSNQRMSWTWGG